MSCALCPSHVVRDFSEFTVREFPSAEMVSEECMVSLTDGPTVDAWNLLCQVTLAQVVVFNHRRGGEAQRMLTAAYCSDTIENVNEDVTACLSRMEMALCKEFCIVHVRGKRGRKVPVLLTMAAQCQIACLLELRSVIGIPAANSRTA